MAVVIAMDVLSYLVEKRIEKKNNDHLSERDTRISLLQQTDITYDSVNFDDPISTTSYFAKLCLPFFSISEEEINKRLNYHMTKFANKKAKDGSPKSLEVKLHAIMRLAAEKIHGALQEFNQDSTRIAITYKLVMLALGEVNQGFSNLVLDCDDDENDKDSYWTILSS